MAEFEIRFNAGVEYKNKLVLSSIMMNGLWVYDLLENRLIAYKKFERENTCYAIHRKAFLYKDEAWFIPQNGKYIAIFNLLNYEISYLEIPYRKQNKMASELVYDGGIFDEKYLYLVPTGMDALNIFNLENREVSTYYDINTEEKCLTYGFYWEKSIYLYSWLCLRFKVVNTETGEITVLDFSKGEKEGITYGEAVLDEGNACVYIGPLENNTAITCIDLIRMKKSKILLKKPIETEQAIDCDRKILFLGFQNNKIIIFDKDTRQVQVRELLAEQRMENIVYIAIDSYENKIVLSRDEQCYYRYIEEQEGFERKKQRLDIRDVINVVEKDADKFFWDILEFDMGSGLKEMMVPLKYFIEKRKNNKIAAVCKSQNNVGKNIYDNLK